MSHEPVAPLAQHPPTSSDVQCELLAWDAQASAGGVVGSGSRHRVWAATVRGVPCVARRSERSAEALDWELDLLEYLEGEGLRVPVTIPALDGRRHVGGLVVATFVDGRAPTTEDDWVGVLAALQHLHIVTQEWPQRPSFRSTQELLTHAQGGDVVLDEMPQDAVDLCRRAWAALVGESTSVVHGDPGVGNVLITDKGVALIDWDESRVDASVLDLADLPLTSIPGADDTRLGNARRAADAWEAAAGWFIEPKYARTRLARLREKEG